MKQKKTIIAVAVLAVLILASVLIWQGTRPETQTGDKTITVSVVTDTETTDFTIVTDAEYLRQALEQENLVKGSESEYGLFVTTVNGVTADDSQQQWWRFTRNGEMVETGIDTTPIADGETYEITLITGW